MLKIYVHPQPQSTTPATPSPPLYGFVANTSRLGAISSYTFAFANRTRNPLKPKDPSKSAPKPPQTTHHITNYPYINVDDLPGHIKPFFLQFMSHQTVPLVPGINAAYAHDFFRFLGPEDRGSAPRQFSFVDK